MLSLLLISVIIALLVAFCIILAEKTGVIIYLASKTKSRMLNMLLSCYFCMGFWLSLFVVIIMAVITKNAEYLIVPIFSSVIVRRLL